MFARQNLRLRIFALFWAVTFVASSTGEVFAAHAHAAPPPLHPLTGHDVSGEGSHPSGTPGHQSSDDHSEACTCHLLCGVSGDTLALPKDSEPPFLAAAIGTPPATGWPDSRLLSFTPYILPWANAPPARS